MNSQDMSIYWNQRKGQYETDNFYQEAQNPYTITADNRLKYQETTFNEEGQVEVQPGISIGSWFGTLLWMLIPGINVFAVLIMACGAKNENKRAFARAVVLISLVMITIALIFVALTCNRIDYGSILVKGMNVAKSILTSVKGLI